MTSRNRLSVQQPRRRGVPALVLLPAVFLLAAVAAQAQSPFPPPPSVEEIDAWVEDAMARWEVPGLGLAIVHEGRSYLSTGYGVRELGRDTPVDGGTLFSIGSCSKAFGAATIASLVEEGKLRWDDRITDHIPWFRLHDPWTTREIRVRDIVTHRVGTGSNQPLRPLVTDRRDYLMRLPHTDPDHPFRDRYGYTNDMFVLTGHLVETVSGTDWDSYAREKLWNPLGMATTTARMAGDLGYKTVVVADATAAHEKRSFDGSHYSADVVHDLALAQLRKLPGIIEGMRHAHDTIKREVEGLPGVTLRHLPDPNGVAGVASGLLLDDPANTGPFVKALRAEGIPARHVYGGKPVYTSRRCRTTVQRWVN